MESLRIEIVNPKAKKIIKDLADMDLIRIKKESVGNADYLITGDSDLLELITVHNTKIITIKDLENEI